MPKRLTRTRTWSSNGSCCTSSKSPCALAEFWDNFDELYLSRVQYVLEYRVFRVLSNEAAHGINTIKVEIDKIQRFFSSSIGEWWLRCVVKAARE